MFEIIAIAVFSIAALYGVVAVTLYIVQRLLIYFPDADRVSPEELGLSQVTEMEFDTPDGERLVAWYAPAQPGRPTLLYFHGNSGNLAHRKERIHRFTRNGYGVLMPSYRGYSGSSGKPSQAWLISDGLMAYDRLRAMGLFKEDIMIYGESLGTGVATPVAVAREAAGLILEAPFSSTVDVAAERYPYFPIRKFMEDRYESIRIIHRIKAPLLVIHGAKDKVIPIELGKKLFDAAPNPKEMVVIDEAGHTRLFRLGAWAHVKEFINTQSSGTLRPLTKSA